MYDVSVLRQESKWGSVRIRHSIREIPTQPVILWIELGGKPKWLPLNFGFHDVMRTAPIVEVKGGCPLLAIAQQADLPEAVIPTYMNAFFLQCHRGQSGEILQFIL